MKPNTRPNSLHKLSRLVHSMRFRLSLWYLAVLAVALLFFGGTIYSIEERTLSATIDAELSGAAEQVSKVISTQNGQFRLPEQFSNILQQLGGLKLPESALGELQNVPGVKSLLNGRYFVVLLDGQGQITQQFGTLSTDDTSRLRTVIAQNQNQSEATTTSFELSKESAPIQTDNNNYYRVEIYPIKQATGNKTSGTLVIGLWWEGAATLQSLLWTLLLAGLATLALTAGGGYWLASRATRPVNRITHLARSISETDLSRRIGLKSRDEIGELAATFDKMLERLENAFERQRQFTADASHELRTPLTIINLELSRVANHQRQRSSSVEEYERALSIIQTENEYMTQLVTNLLLLARSDSGQVNFAPQPLDLSEVALEVVERLAPLARQNNIELVVGELPELEISGDRLYLSRMLANLVENGIKYTAQHGTMVKVEAGVSSTEVGANKNETNNERNNWASVRVKDDGPGIAPEHLPYLFDRFYQIDKARTVSPAELSSAQPENNLKGSGLGLSIVEWVAQLHGGNVKVTSEVGPGTCFEVRLPLLTADDAPSLPSQQNSELLQ